MNGHDTPTPDTLADGNATRLLAMLKSGPQSDDRILLALRLAFMNGYAQSVQDQMKRLQERAA